MLADAWQYIATHPVQFATALGVHVALSACALAIAALIAIPLGVVAARRAGFALAAINVANIGRTLPSLAVLALVMPILGTGFAPSLVALTLLAAPLRSWLEKSFRVLFERETALYREVVAQVGSHVGRFRKLSELLSLIESQTAHEFSLSRVRILLQCNENEAVPVSGSDEGGVGRAARGSRCTSREILAWSSRAARAACLRVSYPFSGTASDALSGPQHAPLDIW